MSQKKTFFSWFTNRYIIVARNEENFAEKRRFVTSYARLTVLFIFIFIVMGLFNYYLITNVMTWLNPYQADVEKNNQIIELNKERDSLQVLADAHFRYQTALKRILEGDTDAFLAADSILDPENAINDREMPEQGAIVEKITQEFESDGESSISKENYNGPLAETYFIRPLEGIITQGFNVKKSQFGVQVTAKYDTTVYSIAEGTIIFSNWTDQNGYVIGIQHKNDIISVYKNNLLLLRRTGDFVKGGEAISFCSKGYESQDISLLELEIWYNGNPVNPEHLIDF